MTGPGQSSLQKTLQGQEASTTHKQKSDEKGEFEACFASGLDISEFTNSDSYTAQSSTESAAAERLRQKEQEKLLKEENAVEERRLVQSIAAKVNHIKNERSRQDNADLFLRSHPSRTDKKEIPDSFGAFLMSMHTSDKSEQRVMRGKKSRPKAVAATSTKAKKKGTRSKHR